MTESSVQETAAAVPMASKAKKVAVSKAKATVKKTAPTHPPTSQMVDNAIKNLKERGGSSLQAIKKYISSTYKMDAEKSAPFIKKYLKQAVDRGQLIQTKGKGASGSFKLASTKPESATKKKVIKPKTLKPIVKKSPKPKKEKIEKKKVTPATPKAVSKPKTTKPKFVAPKKSSSKAEKKMTKAPVTKKLKSPKLKKTTTKKVVKKAITVAKK